MVIPYIGSAEWYSGFVGSIVNPDSSDLTANPVFLARTEISSPGGSITLSVPVEGGARKLRRNPGGNHRVSMHGEWPHIHCGALEAAYGRTPYFPYYFQEIREIIGNPPELLSELNESIHTLIVGMAGLDSATILRAASEYSRFSEVCRETAEKIDFRLSVLDALFRLGPDTIFGLLWGYFNKVY